MMKRNTRGNRPVAPVSRGCEKNLAMSQTDNAASMRVVARRKASIDRRFRFVAMLGRMFSRFVGENYVLHFIY